MQSCACVSAESHLAFEDDNIGCVVKAVFSGKYRYVHWCPVRSNQLRIKHVVGQVLRLVPWLCYTPIDDTDKEGERSSICFHKWMQKKKERQPIRIVIDGLKVTQRNMGCNPSACDRNYRGRACVEAARDKYVELGYEVTLVDC